MHAAIGHTFTDCISGFRGVCVSRTEYLDKSVALGLTAQHDTGNVKPETHFFNEARCVLDKDVDCFDTLSCEKCDAERLEDSAVKQAKKKHKK